MRPVEQALMRERSRLGINETMIFTYLLIFVMVLLIFPDASQSGTVTWAIVLGAAGPLPKIVHGLKASFAKWFRLAFLVEVLNGMAWGSVTWLALPESDVRQALLCTVLTGVMVAASISAAQFRALNLAFLVPFASLSISGYLVNPSGLNSAAIFLAIAFAFSALMASEHRLMHVNLVQLILKNQELVDKLEREHDALTTANHLLDGQAWADSLTGLANRPAMAAALNDQLERLSQQTSEGTKNPELVTAAYIDLNGFKQINDAWGHRTGDLLLIAVADRLRLVMDGTAIADGRALVSRLGGDEFVVISSDEPEVLASSLAQAFAEPLPVGDRKLSIQMSIGVATASHGMASDDLLRHADKALYQHKNGSGTTSKWQIFDDTMRKELAVRRDLEARVHRAFTQGDITVWFQPIVDLVDGQILGAEALARWIDGDRVRTAGEFLHVLTEKGLLDDLTERCFDSAVKVQTQVMANGRPRPRISINVAPQQLEQVLTHRSSEEDFESLAVEITEDSAIPNPERVIELLTEARSLGAEILVDDFGIGYSSLARTASLPIDGLKIDQSFVATLLTSRESSAVVSTVVDLADKLGLSVIAEGVETMAQVEKLLELGVSAGQGFHFSGAVEPLLITEWMSADHRLLDNVRELPNAA